MFHFSNCVNNLFIQDKIQDNSIDAGEIIQQHSSTPEEQDQSTHGQSTHVRITNPPPSPISVKQEQRIQQQLCQLQAQLNNLESLILKPQIIEIIGFHHIKLKYIIVEYKDKLDSLFFEADIPLYWIIDSKYDIITTISDDQHNNTNVAVVYVTMLNYHVKKETIKRLNTFFDTKYENIVYIS